MRKPLQDKLVFGVTLVLACIAAYVLLSAVRRPARDSLGRSFEFRMDDFMQVDPAMIVCEETGFIPVPQTAPVDFAVDAGGRLYIVCENSVVILEADGSPAHTFAVKGPVSCVAVDEDRIYLGAGNIISVYNANGELLEEFAGPGGNFRAAGILPHDMFIYATCAENINLYQLDRSGNLMRQIDDLVLFSIPRISMAMDPHGYLWVASPGERQLRKYNEEFELIDSWTRIGRTIDGFSGCCNPTDIAIRKDGTIVTTEKNIVRVKLMNQAGEVTGVVAAPDKFNQQINHLAVVVDNHDRILVLDPHLRGIRIFEDK